MIRNQRGGVQAVFISRRQIAAIGQGHALWRARFTAAGDAPDRKHALRWRDLTRLRAAARVVGERIAAAAHEVGLCGS